MATRALSPLAAPSPESVPRAPEAPALEPAVQERPGREPWGGPNMWAAAAVIALHVVAFALILNHRYEIVKLPKPEAVLLLDIAAAPPPSEAPPPEIPDIPPVVIPPPVIHIENPPPSITAVVVENPPPPQPAPVYARPAPPAPPAPARPPAPIQGGDLSSSMVEGIPPRYPVESRRLKEQGVVVLDVIVGPDGRVAQIDVRASSGFPRLDQAAISAVRRWRLSPTMRDGIAVPVRGLVEIPFILTKRN